ncbi:MAG: serine/threonine protein kinase [Candidatus Sericytochromatia bacterium]
MIGEVLNQRYKLEELLKEEAQATVYLALDLSLGKSCLVRIMSFSPQDSENIPAYLHQLQEIKQHYHPQIPRLQEVFVLEDELWPKLCLIIQQIEAQPLEQVLQEKGRFSELESVGLLLQLTRIAEYLHGLVPPFIHQGINPENILLTPEGRLYLSGYTLIRRDEDQKQYPLNPLPDYLAPEQLRGEPVEATDLYGIGLTAVEMVSGKPYAQLPSQDLHASLNVSTEFATLLKKLVKEDPAQRFQSATALKNELLNLKKLVEVKQQEIAVDAPLKKKQMIIPVIGATLSLIAILLLIVKFVNRPTVPASGAQPPDRQAAALASRSPRQPAPGTSADPAADQSPGAETADGQGMQELSVNIYNDFAYQADDLPAGIAISESPAQTGREPQEKLVAEPAYAGKNILYGTLALGNGEDRMYSFALDKDQVYFDKNNNEDLSDDGLPASPGNVIAFKLDNLAADGSPLAQPYSLKLTAGDQGGIRFSGRCYYAGKLKIQKEEFDAVAFEAEQANALFKNDGLWVDLNKNGNFEAGEHFPHDGTFTAGKQLVQLKLKYP